LSVMRWILWGIGLCFVLSLGPVLIRDGAALLFGADRAIPLPYFLLEYVWGFRSLTLLYRLSFGVVLGAALLVAQGFSGRRAWLLLGVMCMEIFFWSPVKNLPDWSTIPSSKGFSILKDRTGGVVLNHPVVGGNPYLFEQVLHEKSMMGTLNFPNNRLGSTFWKQLEEGGCSSIQYKEPVYLVSHPKIQHRPQREDRLVERALDECSVVYLGAELIIVELK
jgi:hypothetical protein